MKTLTEDPLHYARTRSQQYWASDGIPLIVMGGFWMLWGLALLLPFLFPERAVARSSVLVICVIGLTAIGMKPLIHRWKERLTFRRTGYIELRQPSKAVRIAIVIVAFVLAFAIGLVARVEDRTYREWLPLGLGVVLAAGMLHSSWKIRSVRLAVFSAAVAASGVIAFILRLHEELSFAVIILTAGMACVADGLLTLRTYLRSHPAPAEEAQ